MIAIGHFDVRDTRTKGGLRDITAVDPKAISGSQKVADVADRLNKVTGEDIEWEQGLYGTFPFSSIGGIDVLAPNVGYAPGDPNSPGVRRQPRGRAAARVHARP